MPSKGKERSEEGDESEKALRAPLSSHVSTHSVSSVAQGGTSPSFLIAGQNISQARQAQDAMNSMIMSTDTSTVSQSGYALLAVLFDCPLCDIYLFLSRNGRRFLTSYYCFAMLLGGSTSVSRGLRVERGERKCGAKWTI